MSDTVGFFDETYDAEQLPDPLPADPFELVVDWFGEANERVSRLNWNTMSLSTVDGRGQPSSRMVLCKDIYQRDGVLVFYTNYTSRKARELDANPRCALLMHWDELGRQIRVEGRVVKSPPEESDRYFVSRAWESKIGAWASEQSRPIESRAALLEKVMAKVAELDLDVSKIVDGKADELVIPRPPFWGGYRVWAEAVELWCNGAGRVHERARWERDLTENGTRYEAGAWSCTRLQP
ncbi:MAG: pyridoxamine 5'-phosphate oxidase [Phycisphaeraceae bacterium]|nr:MAG: pyridoxamine 5'-phosphate oxidase [Phycisphaeraceae bacterium]